MTGTVPIKTAQGQDELVTRQRRLSQRHRTVLFLVDGKRSAQQVCTMALAAGAPPDCFDELLAAGLIMLSNNGFAPVAEPAAADVLHVELPMPSAEPAAAPPDSILPPSRSLYPESVSTGATLGAPLSSIDPRVDADAADADEAERGDALDPAFDQARAILMRAVRAEAPLAGSLTLMRLRRARTRDDLDQLLDEVEARITRPHRSLAASTTMQRVRQLLDGRSEAPMQPAA